ncbi:MAG: hypothetical protein H7Y27_04085, partial [Gemmatimonadaceae bacterium]|nr:hypothetical protein [Chitinophagaceae bacterium]
MMASASGCLTPKKYPVNKPFVFKTNINIEGNLPAGERSDLETRLQNQLDDSLRTRIVTIIPFVRQLVKPPLFDSGSAAKSVQYMNNLLYSFGYYKATVSWDSSITEIQDQKRVTVDFSVVPGKSYKFDSIAFALEDSVLQSIALARASGTYLKKGDPYSVEIISLELDRIVDIFRNQGFYKFSKDDLEAQRDTVFAALIDPSLDPFERLQLLQEAERRQENPTMDVTIKLRDTSDASHRRK